MDRDQEIHRLTARLRALRRFGLDLCLGHMVGADRPRARVRRTARPHRQRGSPAAGRLALPGGRAVLRRDPRQPDGSGEPPQVPLDPGPDQRLLGRGVHRRRLRGARAALDDQSAFIASLGSSRSPRMRDVLGTIQADQDAIIRAGSRGALVVDGGPGTGKTVVALHRTAYLLYSDPRLGHRRGGVLFVGPHQPYLAYVADVLPSLGEEGVQTCTLRDLVPEGRRCGQRARPRRGPAEVVRGHGEGDRAGGQALRGAAHRRAWRSRRRGSTSGSAPPTGPRRSSRASGTPHNEARDQVWEELLAILVDKYDDEEVSPDAAPPVAGPERRAAQRLHQGVAADRGDRPGRRPVGRAGVPAQVCSLARTRRGPEAAARGSPGVDGLRPAAPGRGPAAARRSRDVATAAPA